MPRYLTPTLLLIAGLVPAEEALDPQADQLPLITITATKVPADPVTVPASISITTGTQIIEAGHTSIDDVAASTAGVHFMNLGTHTTYPVIRGMFGLEVDSPVGYYIDGVGQRGLGADQLVDVERVEILRGPQGTLYGRNSVPGIVNVITRDPGREWSGYAIVEGAERRTIGATAAVGGPLHEQVGLRLAARSSRADTSVDNLAPNGPDDASDRDLTLQGKVRLASSSGFTTLTVSGLANRFRSSGDHFAPVDDAWDRQTRNDHEGAFDRDLDSWSATVTQALGDDTALTSVTGASRANDLFDLDQDFTPTPGLTFRRDTTTYDFSQEVRFSGGQGLRSWVIGVYGSQGRQAVPQDRVALPPLAPTRIEAHTNVERASRSMAVFGQAGIPLGERLTLTLGLRGQMDRESVDMQARAIMPDLGGMPVPNQNFPYEDDQNFRALLPKASLSWSWTKTAFTYGTVSRGYRAGGYNNTPTELEDIEGGFDSEFATVWEMGHRATFLDRRVSVNVAVHHTDYTNKQVVILDAPRYYFVNIGRVAIDGGEVEIAGKPTPGLDVFGSLGVIRSEIRDYGGPLQGDNGPLPDLTGKRLSMAPNYDATIGFQWRHPLSGGTSVFVRPETQLNGSYFADNDNNIRQPSYQIINLRVGYEWSQVGLYLWARNLTNTTYLTRGSTTSFPGDERLVGVAAPPRTLGASAQIEF